MADIKRAYAASVNLSVAGFSAGLASSSTHVSGWESDQIDNATSKYLDYLVSGKFTVGASPTAGEIRMWIVAKLDDNTWPGTVFDGVEGTVTTPLDDEGGTNAAAKLGAVVSTDATGNQIYKVAPFSVASLFGGTCPEKFVIFVTHSTVQALATTGNQVTIKGTYLQATA